MVFNNYGTFRKTGSIGGSTVVQPGVAFNNPGTLDSQTGNISLQGAYSLAKGAVKFGLNSPGNFGSLSLSGAAALTGTISMNLNNGYVPAAGSQFQLVTYGSHSGTFNSAIFPVGISFTYAKTAATLSWSGLARAIGQRAITHFTAPKRRLS
ncbi:MAG TPA: hypothetical protein VGO67_07060 [Verrucomicrobiae bacterium]|jgi:hypothetical protein